MYIYLINPMPTRQHFAKSNLFKSASYILISAEKSVSHFAYNKKRSHPTDATSFG